jgi:hypothetical protein
MVDVRIRIWVDEVELQLSEMVRNILTDQLIKNREKKKKLESKP